MASITIQTTPDIDAALSFLGKQKSPQVSGDQYLLDSVAELTQKKLDEANEKRFKLVTELMDAKDKAGSLKTLRELLSV